MELVGRAVEHRSAERIVAREGVRVLPAAAAAKRECPWPPGPPATAARSAGATRTPASAKTTGSSGPTESTAESALAGTEALRELTSDRIELAATDRLQTIVEHAAVETRHVSSDRNGLRRSLRREAGRQQERGGLSLAIGRAHLQSRRCASLCLDRERLESLAPACRGAIRAWGSAAAIRGRDGLIRSSGCRVRGRGSRCGSSRDGGVRLPWRERQLKIDRLRAGRLAHGELALDLHEPCEIGGEPISARRKVDVIRAVRIGRCRALDRLTRLHDHRDARKRRCPARRSAADPAYARCRALLRVNRVERTDGQDCRAQRYGPRILHTPLASALLQFTLSGWPLLQPFGGATLLSQVTRLGWARRPWRRDRKGDVCRDQGSVNFDWTEVFSDP